MMSYVDYSMMYHLIRGQSVIKLYIIYNMLEVQPDDTCTCASARLSSSSFPPLCCQVADRLFSSFGQDILDALYWTATEPKEKKRAHIGVIPHFLMAVLYVCILTEKLLDRLIVCLISSYSYNKLLRQILRLSSVRSVFVSLVCI